VYPGLTSDPEMVWRFLIGTIIVIKGSIWQAKVKKNILHEVCVDNNDKMTPMQTYDSYNSPFSWRYSSQEMRELWSEVSKRRLWRKIWAALAQVQSEFGLVQPEQVEDLRHHVDEIDIEQALRYEAEIHHDLMAELKTFAGQASIGGGVLHLGATSMDIEDNADALRIRAALDLLLSSLSRLLLAFASQIERWSGSVVMAFTHLQPAEPTSLGYRLALYAQDLLADLEELNSCRASIRGKGFKGAVGTRASYADLLGEENLEKFESRLSEILDLPFYPVASQTYTRKQDYRVISALAGLGASIHKFALDLRFLQSPPIGEWSEPFGKKQVGSSAMPFKRNPVTAEKIDSLARLLAGMPRVAWDNAAHSMLERTLDDSANRRIILPESFMIADEIVTAACRIVLDLQIYEEAQSANLHTYAPFAASERVLMALAKAGADRQEMHERLRRHSMHAWEAVKKGASNPLRDYLAGDEAIRAYLSQEEIHKLMDVDTHIGDAPTRAILFAEKIRKIVAETDINIEEKL